ncbi:MAG: hypothetical protein DMG65_15310 [Candidatus Angelobacter sp. Gp1-AA117]|nr:MAG: hypothetical protein DMG65_15310 [Candidatus Angelobacter sp. Gp1-AA117]
MIPEPLPGMSALPGKTFIILLPRDKATDLGFDTVNVTTDELAPKGKLVLSFKNSFVSWSPEPIIRTK